MGSARHQVSGSGQRVGKPSEPHREDPGGYQHLHHSLAVQPGPGPSTPGSRSSALPLLGFSACPPPSLPPFQVVFTVTEEERKVHIPLLLSPFSYTTYRGS